ncbi:MAG: sulfatase-like hydrolase/transferase, partial [Planctomycetales bacterium]|nr:sulfatase-like hydrolase/transferase [Planctomycetales bacterium]
GYHTFMTGKWHLGVNRRECWPLQRGFDRYYGGLSGAFNYFKPGGNRGITDGNHAVQTDEHFYSTDTFTDIACQYITESSKLDNAPFFLYLAYNAPHWPLNSKWEEFQKYRGKYRNGWESLMQTRFARQVQLGMFDDSIEPASHVGPKWDSLTDQQRDDLDAIMAAYAGCIDTIDQNIGKLLRTLENIGRLDNTLIFFLSDNGACQEGGRLGQGNEQMVREPPLETTDGVRLGLAWANACNTPFRLYKHFVHEGGACTPMIAHWPAGIAAQNRGSFVRQLGYLPDFMATCLDVSGAAYPTDLPVCEGQSLLPLLHGENHPIHAGPVYWEHEGNAAVQWGKWKLVRQYEKPWELYDIFADPTEHHDLASRDASQREAMISMWEKWATDKGVAFPQRFNMYEYLQQQKQPRPANQ